MARRLRPSPAATGPVQPAAEGAEIPIPKEPKGALKGRPIKRYSPLQVQEQLRLVEQGIVNGFTERQIQQALANEAVKSDKPYLLVGLSRIGTLKARVYEELKREGERARPQTKEKQLRRLYSDLVRMRQQPKTNFAAIAKHEELISKIEGNFEPIVVEVDVVHREAVTNVIASMTEEQMSKMVEAFDKMAALAESAAKARGEKPPIVVPALRVA